MKSKLAIVLLICLSTMGILWLTKPSRVVSGLGWASKHGEESSIQACERIIETGERALPAIFRSIEKNGIYRRRYCYLPMTLKEIGGSAQEKLITRIDQQNDPKKRDRLIFALRRAFGDSSRNNLIEDPERDRLKPPKKKANQQVDPIVTTPVDEVETQSTQGHP